MAAPRDKQTGPAEEARPHGDVPARADAEKAPQRAKGDDRKFSVERLLGDSERFLGVQRHVLAGALHGNTKKNLTVAEARSLVEEFSARPVEGGS